MKTTFLIIPAKAGIHSALRILHSAFVLALVVVMGAGMAVFGQVEIRDSFEIGEFHGQWSGEVIQSRDNNFITVGTDPQIRCRIIKSNSNGEEIWSVTHRFENNNDAWTQGRDILELQDGSLLVIGNVYINRGQEAHYTPWLSYFSSNGEMQWERRYDIEPNAPECHLILPCNDGGYLVSGWESGGGRLFLLLIKFDSEFEIVWTNTYGSLAFEGEQGRIWSYPSSNVCESSDGGYVLAGYIADPQNQTNNIIVTKIDSNGDTVWNNEFGGSLNEVCVSIQPRSEGGYMLGGNWTLGGLQGQPTFSMSLNEEGDSLNCRFYRINLCHRMIQLSDGSGFLMMGNHVIQGDPWQWLLRINNHGDSLWATELVELLGNSDIDVLMELRRGYLVAGRVDNQVAGLNVFLTTLDPVHNPRILYIPEHYETIQVAIDESRDGDTVLVAAGEYVENINFNGKNIALIGNPDNPEEVAISADGNGRGILFTSEENQGAVVSGFTITGGWSNVSGSGIRIYNASPLIEYCHIIGNYNSDNGGGIYAAGPRTNATIRNCLIAVNAADQGGGIACNNEASILIEGSVIINNHSEFTGASFYVDDHSTISIINSTVSGNSSDREIGVFYCGNGSSISIAGSIVYGNTPPLSRCYGDGDQNIVTVSYSDFESGVEGIETNDNAEVNWLDGNISSDPLFLDPDNGDFHLQVTSPCIDAGDPESDLDPDGTRADMGAYYVHQTFHRIALRQGWNMLSSFNQPRSAAMPAVWDEIVSRGNLFLAKNQSGQFFMPGVFNNMAPWDVRQGYYARLNEADTLIIVNVPVPEDTPIPLRQGWNLISYFPERDLDVRDALAGIVDDVILIKDLNGRFFRPSANFSNMVPMTRGQGYQLGMARAGELVYPDGEQRIAGFHGQPDSFHGRLAAAGRNHSADYGESAVEIPSHFKPVQLTSGNMSVLLTVIPAQAGTQASEIGVFTADDLCVGAEILGGWASLPARTESMSFSGQAGTPVLLTGLAIWADDPTTPEIDGAVEGEALSFRLWDGQAETPILPTWEGQYDRLSSLSFLTDGFAEVTLDAGAFCNTPLPNELALADAFPNPFNSTTLIRYNLPVEGAITLAVTDLAGRQVAILAGGNYVAGSHSVVWNADKLPSGVYLVKLVAPLGVKTSKVVLIK